MSSKNDLIKKIFRYFFICIAPLLMIIFYVTVEDIRMNSELDRVAIVTDYVLKANKSKYYEIMTTVFDESRKCIDLKCKKVISQKIHENIKEMNSTPLYEGIYFIRVNDNGDIEKMFLHGEYKLEKNDTKGEKKVVKFLTENNSIDNFYLKGFRIDSIFSNMHFLNDYYSEAEIIIPIRTYDDLKIIGAIVKGYGD